MEEVPPIFLQLSDVVREFPPQEGMNETNKMAKQSDLIDISVSFSLDKLCKVWYTTMKSELSCIPLFTGYVNNL